MRNKLVEMINEGKKKYFILVGLILSSLFFISQNVDASTVTLDKTTYALTETASATFTCSGNEKNQAYTVNWTNSSGFQLETDTGDTGDCTTFLQNFVVNSSYISTYGDILNATLQGTNLEGMDNATITTAASQNLLISSITHQGTFLGLVSSIDSNVADENGKAISGGLCDANVEDPSNDQVLFSIRSPMIDGNLDFIWFLDPDRFKEDKDYVAKISCFCGSVGSNRECIDEDGVNVNNSIGSSDVAFRTSSWITFHEDPFNLTFDNGTQFDDRFIFAGFDDIHWRRNVSNNNPDAEPIEVETRTILVRNDTKQIFGLVNEGAVAGDLDGFPQANSTSIRIHDITQLATSGVYFIRTIYEVIYKNEFKVAQYIKSTRFFNITSIQDAFLINNVSAKDFFGKRVTLNTSTQDIKSLPNSTDATNNIVLSEAFRFDFCINANITRTEADVSVFIHDLVLENPTTSYSRNVINEEALDNEAVLIYEENQNETELCITENMPINVPTHSDYRFHFEIHIGTPDEEFECGEECDFEGETDFFYVGKLEDMIEMPKFLEKPSATAVGNPGIQIVSRRGEYLTMFDDVNYSTQANIVWGNASFVCEGKNNGDAQICDYNQTVRAGEEIKVCFEGRSYFSDEVFINLFDIYLDNDIGDSQHILRNGIDSLEVGIKSIFDSDLYNASAPSRKLEADGKLRDGYATYCTDWMRLPNDIVGGNAWDIQGHASLDAPIYDLDLEKIWTWESDEFLIYGRFPEQPLWSLHLSDPLHYNIPESWVKLSDTKYQFNISIPSFGSNAQNFTFGEHLPLRLLDEKTPLERVINVSLTYQNGSTTAFTTQLFIQQGEIVFLIENVSLSASNNDFSITANVFDFARRAVVALEDISNKTGTFRMSIDCPAKAKSNSEMTCLISAQIEDPQAVEKEVSFNCFVLDGDNTKFSTLNFNQMVNRSLLTFQKTFLVPTQFSTETDFKTQCEASYFNFGSRTDVFSDTIVIENPGKTELAIFPVGETFFEKVKERFKEILDILQNPEENKESFFIFIIVGIVLATIFITLINQPIKKKTYLYPGRY